MNMRHWIVKLIAPRIFDVANPKYRPMACFLKEYYGSAPLVGAEIGVWEGNHAEQLLRLLCLKQLYLVDNYAPFNEGSVSYSEREMHRIRKTVMQRLSKYPQAAFCVTNSLDCDCIKLESLDFAYIDATHTYEAVKADLQFWYLKVKSKGVLGGHDFTNHFQGLVRAVIEFATATNSKLHFKPPDWWIVKGEPNEGLFS